MRQPHGPVRYGGAYATPFGRRTTKKESRRSPGPAVALDERIEEIMDRVQQAGDNQVERVAALEEYLTLARAHEGETWFDAGAWTDDIGDHAEALEWLTTGLELALRTGDPESAVEQLRPLRASCLSALGRPSDEIQQRAARGEQGTIGER
jgi:hypothetical protein